MIHVNCYGQFGHFEIVLMSNPELFISCAMFAPTKLLSFKKWNCYVPKTEFSQFCVWRGHPYTTWSDFWKFWPPSPHRGQTWSFGQPPLQTTWSIQDPPTHPYCGRCWILFKTGINTPFWGCWHWYVLRFIYLVGVGKGVENHWCQHWNLLY